MLSQPGSTQPQGAIWDGRGTHFTLWSAHASAVELCLFEAGSTRESTRIALRRGDPDLFHAYVSGIGPGQRYGYRIDGPYAPERGHRYNPNKLLVDPYARAIERPLEWHELHEGEAAADRTRPDPRDSAAVVPRCVVIDEDFDWRDDAPPRVALADSLIYECHVKGLTARHPEVPAALRGRFLGLACEPVIAHLRALGVTAVELLPVQQAYSERFLIERGCINYWGYNTLGFFAPDARFATSAEAGAHVREFKTMVRALHRAGIEVILDVVYNHTGEGDARGPTLCLRGVDNAAYYKLDPDDGRRYIDFTGCGNTVDLEHPQALRLVADSLRYWVEEMRVDGFRFDLAPALARRSDGSTALQQGLFALIAQDPVLSSVKLIVEPWDASADGVRLGGFAPGYVEWNGRYRDGLRRFARGDAGQLGELATRLSGSSDLFAGPSRSPLASLNFVACHDGFTLRDLTSYERKHNAANGWDDRDGTDDNASRNFGVEGATERPEILELRARTQRMLLASLALSLGVPMLQQGDEFGRTQHGNNNAYGLDDETSWVDWSLAPWQRALLGHSRRCFALRRELAAFRRAQHFRGEAPPGFSQKDVTWVGADGLELAQQSWLDAERRSLGMWLCGHGADAQPDRAQPSVLLALNGGNQPVQFRVPAGAGAFRMLLDSAALHGEGAAVGASFTLAAHSLCLLAADAGPQPPAKARERRA